ALPVAVLHARPEHEGAIGLVDRHVRDALPRLEAALGVGDVLVVVADLPHGHAARGHAAAEARGLSVENDRPRRGRLRAIDRRDVWRRSGGANEGMDAPRCATDPEPAPEEEE